MGKSPAVDEPEDTVASIDGPSSFYYILRNVSNIDGFLKWMQERHSVIPTGDLLSGYKFFLCSILKCFLNDIYVNSSLELTEDEILRRSQFKGVPLRDTPNTCEKTVLLKRIWSHGKKISKARSWQEIQQLTNGMMIDLGVFGILFEAHCHPPSGFEKDFVLKAVAADHVFTLLNDTHKGLPLAELMFPSIEYTATSRYLFDAFPGYVYGVQFLWHSILGKEEFDRTPVKELHLALDEEEVRKHPREKDRFEKMFEHAKKSGLAVEVNESENDEELEEIKQAMKDEGPARSPRWKALDIFYRPIQNEIVTPRETRLKVALGMSHLLILEGYTKGILGDLLDLSHVPEPDYLTKSDDNSIKKQLSLATRWYDVNVLDTQGLLVFNGVPAFIRTLLGSVELSKIFHDDSQTSVIIFKHPAGLRDQFNYSFGILVEAYGVLSDYSGWLIFFDCATDHSGFGGSMLALAKTAIRAAEERGQISVKEFVVNDDLFKAFLREHSVTSVFDTLIKETPFGTKEIGSLTKITSELDGHLALSKGKFLEYVVHKWIKESQRLSETSCDIWSSGEQIDCVGKIGNTISVFECKLNLHEDATADTIRQITRKVNALSEEGKKVEANLVVYGKLPGDAKLVFERNAIFVTDNFKNKIAEDRCFDGARREILEILDWQFRTPGKFRHDF